NLFRNGVEAGLLGLALMLCGAGGLAFGPPVAVWLISLALWLLLTGHPVRVVKTLVLILLAAAIFGYIAVYFHGYARPEYHPPSAGVLPSLRIALQALSMAFGAAAIGMWPEYEPLKPFALAVVSLGFVALALIVVGVLLWRMKVAPTERPRALGLLLF